MAVNNNNETGSSNGASNNGAGLSTLITFGSGVILGVLVAPFAKEAVKKFSPIFNSMLDQFNAKAASFAEKGADIIAEAKERMTQSELN